MKFSIYTSGFNLIQNGFDYIGALDNFTSFADEVVIAVNSSKDMTLGVLEYYQKHSYKNLKIVPCDFSYDDPLLDGKIKDFALQNTSCEFKIGLDMDERIPLRHKDRWEMMASHLKDTSAKAWMVPSLNLWGDLNSIKRGAENNLGTKWYLHLDGLKRGAVNFAKNRDGTVDTSKSDTCELLDQNDNLVASKKLWGENLNSLEKYLDFIENKGTFIYHLGYASYEDRIQRNRNFWKNHWEVESGGKPPAHKVHMDISEFKEETVPHGLKHWDE